METSVLVQEGWFGLRGPEDAPGLVEEHGVWLTGDWVRIRVSGAGRGVAYDEPVDTAVDGYVVRLWPEQPSATVNPTTGERVQRPGPVEPVAHPGVWVEVVGFDGGVPVRAPRRPSGEGRGPIRG